MVTTHENEPKLYKNEFRYYLHIIIFIHELVDI